MLPNTFDWFNLGDCTYRKLDLLTPEWPNDLHLEYMRVIAAPFGGPLAVIRATQYLPINSSPKRVIRILDTSGQELGGISWDHDKLIAMGWSDTEELICVQEKALVYIYDMFGKQLGCCMLHPEASRTKIVDAKIFQSYSGTGIAVLTTSGRIFIKQNYTKDSPCYQLPDLPKSIAECKCWGIVTEERTSYCLLGRNQEVIRLVPGESLGTVTSKLFDRPFERILHISVSYNNQNLALYTNNGLLWMGSHDMKRKFCEFDTGRKDQPLQIEWIMNTDDDQADAVVIAYESFDLIVVNRNGDKNLFTYDSAVFLMPEMDGVRILSSLSHELMQKLPRSVRNIFAINIKEASGFLFEAYKKFEDKSHLSDVCLTVCRDEMNAMDTAVEDCIEAAGHEFSTDTQKRLLQTAHFGKGFIPSYNPDEYMRILRILRVLNALRHPKVAIPLTLKQFAHLKPNVILERLVFRKHYALAIQMAKHLKLPESWILEHWAYHKVIHDRDDNEVARKITEKFKNPSIEGISFCRIAEKAHALGRDALAIKLLELEPRASLKVVELLLKLDKYDRALRSATQSGDTELVTTVLLDIKKKMMLKNFHIIIREFPMALSIYKKMNEMSRSALYEIYNSEDDHISTAEYHFRNAIEERNLESQLSPIVNSYTKARRTVEANLCSDTARMMKLQKSLRDRYEKAHGRIEFCGMSIHDTILQLLRLGELKEAGIVKKDFDVPDKRYWWLRILILSQKYKWNDLEEFSKSKKSPIGYEPFVEVCLNQNNLHEARKYILKCRDDRKAHWYMRAELYEEAADNAFDQRDLHTLNVLQQKANMNSNHLLMDKINTQIALMASRK